MICGMRAGTGPSQKTGPRSSGPESADRAAQTLNEPLSAGTRKRPSRSVLHARVIGNQPNWPPSVLSSAIT